MYIFTDILLFHCEFSFREVDFGAKTESMLYIPSKINHTHLKIFVYLLVTEMKL